MAAKKTQLILSVSYYGKNGVVPAGQVVDLPAKEAAEFVKQGLGVKPGEAAPTPQVSGSGEQVALLQAKVAKLEAQLTSERSDCVAKLQQAQDYAMALEQRLRDAGLFDDSSTEAGE
ncbi:hypothetical protein JCM16814_29610 [Desulfobaculum senezii]